MQMLLPMRMIVPILLFPEHLAWQVLFSAAIDINFCRRDPTSHDAGYFEPCAHIERRDCVFQQLRRHAGIHQCTQKHVATDAGETLKVGNTHKVKILNHRGHRGSQSKTLKEYFSGFLWVLCG